MVVFEVGGVIDMAGGTLDIKHPFLTIAGQTAPSPGVTVIRAETLVRTHDVIVQHLRFRPGEFGRPKKGGGDQDGLSTVGGAHDVIVDHCSFSWATDENLSASGPRFAGSTPKDWRRGTHIASPHQATTSSTKGCRTRCTRRVNTPRGSLIHDNTGSVLLYGNVYISNRERNALFKAELTGDGQQPDLQPWHAGGALQLCQEWEGKDWQSGRLSMVGNRMLYGPDTQPGVAFFTQRGAGHLELYMADNLATDRAAGPVALLAMPPMTKPPRTELPRRICRPGLRIGRLRA